MIKRSAYEPYYQTESFSSIVQIRGTRDVSLLTANLYPPPPPDLRYDEFVYARPIHFATLDFIHNVAR